MGWARAEQVTVSGLEAFAESIRALRDRCKDPQGQIPPVVGASNDLSVAAYTLFIRAYNAALNVTAERSDEDQVSETAQFVTQEIDGL